MIQNIFSIFDEKAKAFLPPILLPHVGQMEREFKDAVNDITTAFYRHPEDYTLFKLGTFDNETGMHKIDKTPEPLHNGVTQVDQAQRDINNAKSTLSNEASIQPSPEGRYSAQ